MSKFDYEGLRALAHSLIGDAGMVGALRREGNSPLDRTCLVCIYDYQPRPRENKLVLPVERRCLISAFTPEGDELLAPDFEQDQLVVYAQPLADPPVEVDVLRFACPAKLYAPAGLTLCYELQVKV